MENEEFITDDAIVEEEEKNVILSGSEESRSVSQSQEDNSDFILSMTEEQEPIELEPIETDNKIYFDNSKTAHSSPIDNPLCITELEEWKPFTMLTLGKDYDITADGIIDLRQTPEYISEKFETAKANKHAENTQKAKQIIENGYVIFKDAQFETNAQTVGDLTATMLMLQAVQNISHSEPSGEESLSVSQSQGDTSGFALSMTHNNNTYNWLSKDDKLVELSLEDFAALGVLIAEYKNTVWNTKYIAFKTAIEQAQTIEELNAINIDY